MVKAGVSKGFRPNNHVSTISNNHKILSVARSHFANISLKETISHLYKSVLSHFLENSTTVAVYFQTSSPRKLLGAISQFLITRLPANYKPSISTPIRLG